MSFNLGLSGLNAASADMNVIGNNIANVGTIGFKASRAEFADLYLAGKTGSGSYCSNVFQQMNGGNINGTGRNLDLAIDGQGYFIVQNNGEQFYTRAGAFYPDQNGNIINSSGDILQGYALDANGKIKNGTLENLALTTTAMPAHTTTKLSFAVSLDSNSAIKHDKTNADNAYKFDPKNEDSFNWLTNTTIYDSQGNAHDMVNYFVKTASNNWDVYTLVDGEQLQKAKSITFDVNGKLDPQTAKIELGDWQPKDASGKNNGAAQTPLSIDLTASIQANNKSALSSAGVSQDGYKSGLLTNVNVDENGQLFATFNNGQTQIIGQVALATFANEQGLESASGSKWRATIAAGNPAIGAAHSGLSGKISAGALEDSNVDLTAQLVKMIVAQRNYQANAKTIETASTLSQTILNIR